MTSSTTGVQKEKCLAFLAKLSDADKLSMFARPVDAQAVPGYYDVIKSAMDLSTIRQKLEEKRYACDSEVEEDVALMVSNALDFNKKDSPHYAQARKIRDIYHSLAQSCGLNVDSDTVYIPRKRFRDDESTLEKAERASGEDMRQVLDELEKNQAIDLEELRQKYLQRGADISSDTDDEEDEENSDGDDDEDEEEGSSDEDEEETEGSSDEDEEETSDEEESDDR